MMSTEAKASWCMHRFVNCSYSYFLSPPSFIFNGYSLPGIQDQTGLVMD